MKWIFPVLAAVLVACSGQSSSSAPPRPVQPIQSSGPAASPALHITQVPQDAAQALTKIQAGLGPCAHISQHQYEVCTAYLYSSALRWIYYRYGRDGSLPQSKLEDRFWGDARRQIENQASGWPPDVVTTAPRISIIRVDSNLAKNTATLQTRESWTVQQKNGPILFAEKSQLHTVVLKRVPSILLHKWVVTEIR